MLFILAVNIISNEIIFTKFSYLTKMSTSIEIRSVLNVINLYKWTLKQRKKCMEEDITKIKSSIFET
jgi:hypothetical protein